MIEEKDTKIKPLSALLYCKEANDLPEVSNIEESGEWFAKQWPCPVKHNLEN